MDIRAQKDACNAKYARAIEGLEQGEPQAGIARLLLDAASDLLQIGKLDVSQRAQCEQKAQKLLNVARNLRQTGDASAAYAALTGRRLPVKKEEPPRERPVQAENAKPPVQGQKASAFVQEEEPPKRSEEKPSAQDEEPFVRPQGTFDADHKETEPAERKEKNGDGEASLDELKGLLRRGSRSARAYGGEDTSGYRFAWDDLPKVSFDDVAGLADVKEAVLRKVLLPLKNPELYEGYVKKNGGGLLLYGPPGTGKTMIAAAIAHEIGAKFCSLGPSDLVLGGIGNSEKAVVALFKEARSFPCAVLFFDEIESICPASTHAQGARQLRSELLRQIQGMEAYGEQDDKILFLIAATNKPWDIDPAFVRPGRFGTRIYVGLPDAPARRYMLDTRLNKILQTGKVLIGNVDADAVVERTEGFNGADMANLLDEVQELSALRSAKTGIKEILQEDFDRALEKITSSVQEKDLQKLREWKEQNG